MTLFVIDIGTNYGKYSIPILKKFCEINSIELFVLSENLKENIYNVHPSWLKLFCHKIIEDDFIICWDLDLLPVKPFKLIEYFDLTKINMGYDWSLYDDKTNLFNKTGFNYKFKYNCGLIGIPKSYSLLFENIYKKAHQSFYPSYEQYHVNDVIFDNKIEINILDPKLNFFLDIENFPEDAMSIHYTWKIKNNDHRAELIKKHYDGFYKNFI